MSYPVREMLPISEWKRLTVINCKFSKNDLYAQVPFIQPFDFDVYDDKHSSIDIADMMLERTKIIFPQSEFAVKENMMFRGQIEEFLANTFPSKHYLQYQWVAEDDTDEYIPQDNDKIRIIDEADIPTIAELENYGFSLSLTARLRAGSEESCLPLVIFAKYQSKDEEEVLRQLNNIEMV